MRAFGKNPAIRLFTFLSTLRDASKYVRRQGVGSCASTRLLLEAEAKEVLLEKMEEKEEQIDPGRTMMGTCQHICNALL